jgi:hypothetical protein
MYVTLTSKKSEYLDYSLAYKHSWHVKKNYEFDNILNVIYVISVNDKLEPQSNDRSQCIFGSFSVNTRKYPLCDIKFIITSRLKPAVGYLYVRSFFGYSPKVLAHLLLKRMQLP